MQEKFTMAANTVNVVDELKDETTVPYQDFIRESSSLFYANNEQFCCSDVRGKSAACASVHDRSITEDDANNKKQEEAAGVDHVGTSSRSSSDTMCTDTTVVKVKASHSDSSLLHEGVSSSNPLILVPEPLHNQSVVLRRGNVMMASSFGDNDVLSPSTTQNRWVSTSPLTCFTTLESNRAVQQKMLFNTQACSGGQTQQSEFVINPCGSTLPSTSVTSLLTSSPTSLVTKTAMPTIIPFAKYKSCNSMQSFSNSPRSSRLALPPFAFPSNDNNNVMAVDDNDSGCFNIDDDAVHAISSTVHPADLVNFDNRSHTHWSSGQSTEDRTSTASSTSNNTTENVRVCSSFHVAEIVGKQGKHLSAV